MGRCHTVRHYRPDRIAAAHALALHRPRSRRAKPEPVVGIAYAPHRSFLTEEEEQAHPDLLSRHGHSECTTFGILESSTPDAPLLADTRCDRVRNESRCEI